MGQAAENLVTPDEAGRFSELIQDPEWRIDNLYFIRDKEGKEIRFIRNESQRKAWFDMHYLNIILKDRQRGFSTLIALYPRHMHFQ